MTDLLASYSAFLGSMNITSDNAGLLTLHIGDTTFPVTCDGKRLALPTQEILRHADWANIITFHPLCESFIRKESKVLRRVRSTIITNITQRISELATQLLAIAADKNDHATLSPKQTEMLKHLPDVDGKVIDSFKSVVQVIKPNGPERFVNIYPKNGGQIDGVGYHRVSIVSFPILEEFDKPEYVIYGVKMRKKDKIAIQAVINWMLIPEGEKTIPNYSVGSSDLIAPYFDSLFRSFVKLSEQLNDVADLFKDKIDNYKQLRNDLSWVDDFKDLSIYKGMIPTLNGNSGELEEEGVAKSNAPTTPTGLPYPSFNAPNFTPGSPPPAKVFPKLGAPMPNEDGSSKPPPVAAENLTLDWARTVQSREAVAYNMPRFPTVGGYNQQPPPPYQGGGYPQQQQYQQYPQYPQQSAGNGYPSPYPNFNQHRNPPQYNNAPVGNPPRGML